MPTPSAICRLALLTGSLWGNLAAADDSPYARLVGVDAVSSESHLVQAAEPIPGAATGHWSIVGAVTAPGTYATQSQSVLLRTVIEQAGGLTEHATGIVRILHDGRQQMINLAVSGGADIVPANAVIVADASTQTVAGSAPSYVDVACLQLCERPVVLCMRPSNATLPRALVLLGQATELSASVRVFLPAGAQPNSDQSLPSGSVIVFAPSSVDQAALARTLQRFPLNDIVEFNVAEHQTVAAETVQQLESLEQFLAPAAHESALPTAALPSPATVEEIPAPPESTLSAVPPALAEVLSAPDPAPERAPIGLPVRPASALQLRSVSAPPVIPDEEFTQEDYLRAKRRTAAARADQVAEAEADEVVVAPVADASSQWLQNATSIVAWLLCAFAAYGAFGIWMRQHERRRRVARQPEDTIELPRPAPAVESRSTLTQLIENSLPMREEDAATPSQVFHGRTVGFRYLIRSGPHPLQGPHFAAPRVPSPEKVTIAETARPQPAPRAKVQDRIERTLHRVDRPSESKPAPTLERAVVTADSSSRTVSPMERALRSLLRERSEGRT